MFSLLETCRPSTFNFWRTTPTIPPVDDVTTTTTTSYNQFQEPSPCPPRHEKEFCHNNGTCRVWYKSDSKIELYCECKPGYEGFQCLKKTLDGEYPIRENSFSETTTLGTSNSKSSNENEQIVNRKTLKLSFECSTTYAKDYCFNKGKCVMLSQAGTEHILMYSCHCVGDYIGERCEYKLHETPQVSTTNQRRNRRGLSRMRKSKSYIESKYKHPTQRWGIK